MPRHQVPMCTECGEVPINFPYDHCPACLLKLEEQQELERPYRERAERLDSLQRDAERWEPQTHQILTNLIEIVKEINEATRPER